MYTVDNGDPGSRIFEFPTQLLLNAGMRNQVAPNDSVHGDSDSSTMVLDSDTPTSDGDEIDRKVVNEGDATQPTVSKSPEERQPRRGREDIRQRTRVCRDRMASAAREADEEEKRSEPREVRPEGPPCPKSSNASTAVGYDIVAAMRLMKTCWVETTANGVTSREWRPPTRPMSTEIPMSSEMPSELPSDQPSDVPSETAVPTTTRTAMKTSIGKTMAMTTTKAKQRSKKSKKVTARSSSAFVERTMSWSRTASPMFEHATWPSDIIDLSTIFNPKEVKFTFETPFHEERCGCIEHKCTTATCPNGLLNVFCTEDNCSQRGRCGNSLVQHRGLQVAKKLGRPGLTVIAKEAIDSGVIGGEYLGQMLALPRNESMAQNGYVYQVQRRSESHPNHDIYIDAARMGGITRLMNHSCKPAAVFSEVRNGSKHTIVVVTCRNLEQGEEVTVDYGRKLWFVCKCGEPNCQHRDHRDLQSTKNP